MEVLIIPIEKSLVLRARGSELLILDHHVSVLKGLTKSKDFIEYFNSAALVNRAARKLFEAWLRKDSSLWKRIFQTIGEMEVEVVAAGPIVPKAPAVKPKEEVTKPSAAQAPKVKAESKSAPKVDSKPAAKEAPKAAKKEEKKAAAKPAAKTATPAKKVAKKAVKKKQTTSSKKKTSSKA